MNGAQRTHVRASYSTVALWGVAVCGIVLTHVFLSPQAQNMIQIGACSALAGILLHGLHKTDAVVDAAVELAARLAERAPETGGGAEDDQELATVVSMPQQRSEPS